jgi:sulfonate transport system substrate-binding protein
MLYRTGFAGGSSYPPGSSANQGTIMKRLQSFFFTLLAVVGLVLGSSASARADKPSVIRIAYPQVGIGNRPFVGDSSTAVAHLKGLLDEEFKNDGIKISWTFLRGAGPAVNELYANGLVDFSLLGDLPFIVGQASGLKRHVLAASGIRANTYLAVPADSDIKSIKDLRGRKVALFKGTNIQLAINKLLEQNGMTEKDIRGINMDVASSKAALVTKDVDAVFGSQDLLALRDQGTAKIIYATKGDPKFLKHATFIGADEFTKKYPDITKRVVKQIVLAAKWISDNDKTPAPVFQLYTKSGVPFSAFKEDREGQSLKVLASPLVDQYVITQYQNNIIAAKRYGLIKQTFNFTSVVDDSFLKQVLKELNLESYWAPVDASGVTPKS